jgi:tripartite-type tricarboxylate transporter receptor subunit TctC
MEGAIMKLVRRQFLCFAAATAAAPALPRVASAQVYPSRPITLIVPFPAGGPADTIGRIMAEGMRASLGRSVIVENIGGASGSIGTGRAARAAADGYTLSFGSWPTHVVNGAVYALPYDVLNDFEPVSLVATQPLLIIAKKAMPAKDLKELIAWLKANSDKATQGTAGAGGASHVAGVLFQRETGTRFQFVPYRGTGMQDLMAGLIDMMIDLAANSLPQVRADTIKVYAVTATNRLAAAPDIPTVAEAGLPGLQMTSWTGLWVPKGTPKDVIAKLNAAVVDALANPAIRSQLANLGQEIFPREQQTPEALGAHHKAEIEKWWPIIKAANIKAE